MLPLHSALRRGAHLPEDWEPPTAARLQMREKHEPPEAAIHLWAAALPRRTACSHAAAGCRKWLESTTPRPPSCDGDRGIQLSWPIGQETPCHAKPHHAMPRLTMPCHAAILP